jgi:signal peptidase II
MIQFPKDNFRNPAAVARYLLTAVIGIAIDLWTKRLAQHDLQDRAPIRFIDGWLHFEYTQNHGAVFGIGQGQRMLFIAVSIAALAFLTYLFATSGRQRIYQFVLGLLLAGVIGNLYDRIAFSYVRDMIHALPRWPNLFPWIFNVADSLLCTGVFLMIVYSMLHREHSRGVSAPIADARPQR